MGKVLEGLLVVSLEKAEGDFARGCDSVVHGESAYCVWLNRGKQSLRIDPFYSPDFIPPESE